jgi:hypothetical protein
MKVLEKESEATKQNIGFNINGIKNSLNSGAPIKLPQKLSREEKRQFIINNR